ncbi:hypothetical protein [Campylobacter troglodytis]|uniref:hypothetical protein n=1 Tax=Campylobacter troglodytis TaxID=654363 RepID=UPI00115A3278|nr:hypothetical protein [Campylobacter troglodytis]TQR53273.1 hypothetical protein DMC01_11485 [Campylobacter troglodytis]
MAYVSRGLDLYYSKHKEYPKDISLRKQIVKDWYIAYLIVSVEGCVADNSRIISELNEKIYKQRLYDDCSNIYPDGKGGFVIKDDINWVQNGAYVFQDQGPLGDTSITEYIYHNKTINDIYKLRHLAFIKGYKEEMPLSFMELIYPAKMPIKDYFPFIEFDLGTNISLALTKEDKEGFGDIWSEIEIGEDEWSYCIIWIAKDRMLMSLEYELYYFKQIRNNVHLFELSFH